MEKLIAAHKQFMELVHNKNIYDTFRLVTEDGQVWSLYRIRSIDEDYSITVFWELPPTMAIERYNAYIRGIMELPSDYETWHKYGG